jgi:uncharacterized protein
MKPVTPENTIQVLPVVSELSNRIRNHYGHRLNGVILYGSHARGEASKESDIDLLVVLNQMNRAFHEIDVLTDLKFDLSLDHDLSISLNPTTTEILESSDLPLFRNIRREGIWI